MEIDFAKKQDLHVTTFKLTRPRSQKQAKISLWNLNSLLLQFSNYFGDFDFTKFFWIHNPFNDEDDEFGLTSIGNEKLRELSCDIT